MAEMSREAKQARNEYNKEWRQKNPEAARKYQAAYWEKVAQQKRQKGE